MGVIIQGNKKTTCEVKFCGCGQPPKTKGGASFQDVRYGKGMRVFNVTKTSDKVTKAKCTCCGSSI